MLCCLISKGICYIAKHFRRQNLSNFISGEPMTSTEILYFWIRLMFYYSHNDFNYGILYAILDDFKRYLAHWTECNDKHLTFNVKLLTKCVDRRRLLHVFTNEIITIEHCFRISIPKKSFLQNIWLNWPDQMVPNSY